MQTLLFITTIRPSIQQFADAYMKHNYGYVDLIEILTAKIPDFDMWIRKEYHFPL